ncbi:toxin-antitoxin system YwqK family antitoxin [Ferruginibacter profundus]
MKKNLFSIALCLFVFSCTTEKKHATKLEKAWLDTIIKNSDSSYTKPYFRTDFVTATYYVNNKDSSTCQLMKDSAGIIRQVIIVTKNIRTFFGQYYSNGQLQAWLPLDTFGQYNGDAVYYYSNGTVSGKGSYKHGLKNGLWKNYDDKGNLVSTDEYDANGGLIRTLRD